MNNKSKIIFLALFGTLFNVTVFLLLNFNQEQSIEKDYYFESVHVVSALKKEAALNFEVLRQLQQIYSEFGEISPGSFSNVTHFALATYPTIQALEWIPNILHSERAEYELQQSTIYTGFHIKQRNASGEFERVEEKERYFPVGVVEPVVGNEAAIGFDLSSSPARRVTLEKSARKNQMLATAGINLVQVESEDKGFLVFLPVYAKKGAKHTLANVKGFVLGVYQSTDILRKSLSDAAKNHSSVKIFDQTDTANPTLITSYAPANFTPSDHKIKFPPLNIAGRSWVVEASPSQQYIDENKTFTPMVSAIIGFVILFVFLNSYYRTVNYAQSVEDEVKKRTKELEQSRYFIESLTNAVPVLLAYIDKQEKYHFVNQKYLSLFNKNISEFTNVNVAQMMNEKQYSLIKPDLDRALNGKAAEIIEEFFITGKQYWLRISFTPKVDDSTNVEGIFISIEDMTQQINDRNQMEEYAQKIEFDSWAIEDARDKAEEATRLKSKFLANMSHEIRTPLSGVMGLLQLVSDTELTSEQHEYIELAHSSANSLLTIINDILDLSKVEAGRLEIESRSFCIYEKVKGVQQTYQLLAHEKGLAFEFQSNLQQKVEIIGDEVRILQIINNLMNNALKFTKSGKINLITNLIDLTGRDAKLEIKVSDTGIGVDKHLLSNLFDAFEQADSSTSREFGGTGLGLTISRKLAELMNGNITVESEVGVGTTFTCTLATEMSQNQRSNEPATATQKITLFDGITGLIVEDNPVNQMIAKKVLDGLGVETVIVGNGQEALDALNSAGTHFDIVFMDCMMPIMDGYEASQLIKADDHLSSIPIIAMTANAMQGDREKCIAAGMDEYISKPLNKHVLEAVLQNIFQSSTR
ncbi:CHASE domain-containing protein [Pseudoalteromonas obscura]|uniref:histidine kinase n=1 Tax=Pseudoalteromonas obscura TaxID=3048491 RepID=A0ABT7EPS4_9GAMM|nr:CHASE domain-containing protein [Pseudoalteromonas sp. P94(2023)]MDK2597062.1 CHASE domain-containing protein [Pseudoalteromonas sp. P94(2023)]